MEQSSSVRVDDGVAWRRAANGMNDGRLSGIQVLVRGSGTWSGSVASACLGRTPQGALQTVEVVRVLRILLGFRDPV